MMEQRETLADFIETLRAIVPISDPHGFGWLTRGREHNDVGRDG